MIPDTYTPIRQRWIHSQESRMPYVDILITLALVALVLIATAVQEVPQ